MTDSTEQDRTPQAGQTPSPGARLRAARERKGLTLVEAADAMRLDQSLVNALERDDFAALGAPVFAKGHLRKYAALTGEPVDDLLLAYHQRAGVQEAPPLLDRAALVRAAERPPRGMPVAVIFALLLLGGAAGIWWWYEQPVEGPTPIGSVGTTGALAAAAIEPEPEAVANPDRPDSSPDPEQESAAGETAVLSQAPVVTVGDTSVRSEAPAAVTTTAATGTGAVPVAPATTPPSAAVPDAAPPAQATTAPLAAPAPPRPGDHALTLNFKGDSWAEVRDARGERLYYDLGVSGSRRSLRGLPPFEIFLGRYLDVSVELDGQVRSIPADAVRGDTARFTLDPT